MHRNLDTLKHRSSLAPALFCLACLFLPYSAICAGLKAYNADKDPDFLLPDLKGGLHSLGDYKGKVVLVNFWASWCPPCIYEMPEMARLKQHLHDKPFEVLTLNVGEKKHKVRRFVKLINFDLPVLLDTSKNTFGAWGIKTLPTSFIIDAKGVIRYRANGDPGWDDPNTMAIINTLISEQAATELHKETTQ